ncbi:adhesion G protein-coupled receptor F4-like [Chanos chanos]|uniref:Adhesion G protein-coupled receptor F4-like n=1 Tax=Chanos chanos TaxID=29144 RepID=A0A6J2UL48_CHACN|nr:adhesion G protein-coupled receptor F4-like [Chanos chanos]
MVHEMLATKKIERISRPDKREHNYCSNNFYIKTSSGHHRARHHSNKHCSNNTTIKHHTAGHNPSNHFCINTINNHRACHNSSAHFSIDTANHPRACHNPFIHTCITTTDHHRACHDSSTHFSIDEADQHGACHNSSTHFSINEADHHGACHSSSTHFCINTADHNRACHNSSTHFSINTADHHGACYSSSTHFCINTADHNRACHNSSTHFSINTADQHGACHSSSTHFCINTADHNRACHNSSTHFSINTANHNRACHNSSTHFSINEADQHGACHNSSTHFSINTADHHGACATKYNTFNNHKSPSYSYINNSAAYHNNSFNNHKTTNHNNWAGSIIADFVIQMTENTQAFDNAVNTATTQVANNLAELDYTMDANSFAQTDIACQNSNFGVGSEGDIAVGSCKENEVGSITAECQSNKWVILKNTCVLRIFQELETESEKVSNATTSNQNTVTTSSGTVTSIVSIVSAIANTSQSIQVGEDIIENVLETVEVISSDNAKEVWDGLNNNTESQRNSSSLLQALETIVDSTSPGSFTIKTANIEFTKTSFKNSFRKTVGINSTGEIFIPGTAFSDRNVSITTVAFSNLNNVLPPRDAQNSSVTIINGIVLLINVTETIDNISLSFHKLNTTLATPQCVFWDFDLFNGSGGWSSFGCELKIDDEDNVTCECNHTTSFSILMSPYSPNDPALSYITFIGVAVSMGSLVLCLIIEVLVWKAVSRHVTSYIRHIAIVNIAVSLLIADIWFIVGASIENPEENVSACSAAAFFIHFFYLAMFFWMLVSALLLFYRTVMVLSQMSKSAMLAIAFTLGYVVPLIISVTTVAATAGRQVYVSKEGSCWLNWDDSKALLAFVIPALTIVLINFLIMIVVLYKIVCRNRVGDSTQSDERNTMVVIARCVAILTPLFGITWGFGLGILINPKATALHYLFAIFNSFQGFFILVFGTLLDQKIREILGGRFRLRNISSSRTRSTSSTAVSSSTSGFNIFRRRRGRTPVSQVASSGNTGASESFISV